MAATVTASLDVMGGDKGAEVVLPGAEIALSRNPDLRFRLYGQEAIVVPLLSRRPALEAVSTFEHCEISVKMDDKPSQALRRGRWRSSMWRSIEAVKSGSADYAVSAGNTGALMAMAKFCLRGSSEIDRPAIAGLWPTLKGESILLDCGATIGADAEVLFEFAVMGAAMARALFAKARPTVGLLNIGVEEVKGLDEIRLAGQMLKDAALPHLEYVGFVEGNDIGKGVADVIVTEGFVGNIALKAAEGTARQITGYIREAVNQSLMARLGFFLAGGAFARLRQKLDTRRTNGGVFLGLNGIVIKSHGGADAESFAAAIEIGRSVAKSRIVDKINEDLAAYRVARAMDGAGKVAKTGAL
ncbi:MAG: phosphate acyltransferase PlsX [Bauldia sp.]|jgi:glycerol-3-phosphate acyltransferase PlsX|nr:phosphate acyltransferase PlsX [Bauldia sp.]